MTTLFFDQNSHFLNLNFQNYGIFSIWLFHQKSNIQHQKLKKWLFNSVNSIILLILVQTTALAQKISNLTATQEGEQIRISYELETTDNTQVYGIQLFCSQDKYAKPLQQLSGNGQGKVQGKGQKTVFWNVLNEQSELVGNFSFKVKGSYEGKEEEKKDLPTDYSFTIDGVKFEMVYVEGGDFMMGYDSKRDGNDKQMDNAKPLHKVELDGFWIGKYEITQKQWKVIMGKNPSNFKGDNLPVETIYRDDCQKYLKKLNEKTGKNFNLPTEAQWEYAARGGKKSQNFKYAGSNDLDKMGWYSYNSDSKTHEVGTKKPNELGIYDMSGNVWEWCLDYYDQYYYQIVVNNCTNCYNNRKSHSNVARGGCWIDADSYSRVASRSYFDPTGRGSNVGFRFVGL